MRPLLEGHLTPKGFAAHKLRTAALEPCSPAHSAAVQSLWEAGLAKGASPGSYSKFIACPYFLSQFCFLLRTNTDKQPHTSAVAYSCAYCHVFLARMNCHLQR